MAPRRPETGTSVKKSNPKKSEDRVVKKAARRFPRFKNGMLNFTPKDAAMEQKVTNNSSASPLLRLPPEIRTIIWEYVFGGQVVDYDALLQRRRRRTRRHYDREYIRLELSVLRVCRQIYSETANLPYMRNTFSFSRALPTFLSTNMIRPSQRSKIASIEIKCQLSDDGFYWRAGSWEMPAAGLINHLPGLKHISIEADLSFYPRMYIRAAWEQKLTTLLGIQDQMDRFDTQYDEQNGYDSDEDFITGCTWTFKKIAMSNNIDN